MKSRDSRMALVYGLFIVLIIGYVVWVVINFGISFQPLDEILKGIGIIIAFVVVAWLIAYWIYRGEP